MGVENLREFELSIREWTDEQVPEMARKFQNAVVLEAAKGLIFASPVDTGRFRGNWQVGDGNPVGTIEVDPDGNETLRLAVEAIEQLEPYSLVYVANGVPYAIKLEEGHSDQAPDGVVEVTLNHLEAWLDSAAGP